MIDDILAKFDGTFAKNTIRAYRSDFIQYQTWCYENSLLPIPATADTMAMYIDYLSGNNKSATICRGINSLGTVLKLSRNYDPTKQPEVILVLKRMHRKIGRAQEQATKPCAAGRKSAPLDLRTSARGATENRLSGLTSQR